MLIYEVVWRQLVAVALLFENETVGPLVIGLNRFSIMTLFEEKQSLLEFIVFCFK